MLQISAAALAGTLCLVTLKSQNSAFTMLVAIVTCGVILLGVASLLRDLLTFLRQLAALAEVDTALLTPVLKTAGIAAVTGLTAQISRDSGSGSIAMAVEFCGTVCALYAALPLLEAVLGLLSELL